MKPNDKLKAWKAEPALDRVEGCMVMLYCHNFLSEAEKDRVRRANREVAEETQRSDTMTSAIRTVDDVLALLEERRQQESGKYRRAAEYHHLYNVSAHGQAITVLKEIIAEITRRRAGSDGEVGT